MRFHFLFRNANIISMQIHRRHGIILRTDALLRLFLEEAKQKLRVRFVHAGNAQQRTHGKIWRDVYAVVGALCLCKRGLHG